MFVRPSLSAQAAATTTTTTIMAMQHSPACGSATHSADGISKSTARELEKQKANKEQKQQKHQQQHLPENRETQRGCNNTKPTQRHRLVAARKIRGRAAAPAGPASTMSTSLRSSCGCHMTASSWSGAVAWRHFGWLAALLLIVVGCEVVEGALRNVNLIIEPPAVRRGQHAVIRCLYDLEEAPLYSAKFYRGQFEFYRYTPGEFPNTKVFAFPGIHVDVTSSNATQVLIRNVGFGLSGNFSCEVSADAPLFSTATAVGTMQVVELPEKRPQLYTEQTRYEPGDSLRANCSTPPSRPRAELRLTINNMQVGNVEPQYIRTIDNLIVSRISLKLQLQAIHFSNPNTAMYANGHGGYSSYIGHNSVMGAGGSLVLRCTAQIGDLYQEYKEIELGTPQRDPVPARVTLSAGSSMRNFFYSYFSSSAHPSAAAPPAAIYLLLAAAIVLITVQHGQVLAATTGRNPLRPAPIYVRR